MLPPQSPPEDSTTPDSGKHNSQSFKGSREAFFVRGADETFQFKRLDCQKDSESIALNFQTHNQAPWDTLTTAEVCGTWRLNAHTPVTIACPCPRSIASGWKLTFKPWRLSDMPMWVQDIGLVTISMVSFGYSRPLDRLAEQVDPTKTLLYLVGWRKDGYDVNYP